MKPKTQIQKEVARLSARLPKISDAQMRYAFDHCFDYIGRRYANGTIVCTKCGQSWKGNGYLTDTLCDCKCPHCGTELRVDTSRRRVFRETEYFSIITTCKEYQIIRFFLVKLYCRVGQPAAHHICEVVQRWIAPDGKTVTIARLRGIAFIYYDLWQEDCPMEVRCNQSHRAYDIHPSAVYPRMRYTEQIRRNGFNGNCHNIPPFDLFVALLSNPQCETLFKANQIPMLRYALRSSLKIADYWQSVKICIRNGYIIPDGAIWKDYIDILRAFGKDTNNAKYVCPDNLAQAHDKAVAKRNALRERARQEEQRRKALADEQRYRELKEGFFGLAFTDGIISVRVLESVREFYEEGKAMSHCVFSNAYYLKPDSLILSATIDGKRIETIEVALEKLQVVQSRGVYNSKTEYHDRIVALVNKNMAQIRKRIAA